MHLHSTKLVNVAPKCFPSSLSTLHDRFRRSRAPLLPFQYVFRLVLAELKEDASCSAAPKATAFDNPGAQCFRGLNYAIHVDVGDLLLISESSSSCLVFPSEYPAIL